MKIQGGSGIGWFLVDWLNVGPEIHVASQHTAIIAAFPNSNSSVKSPHIRYDSMNIRFNRVDSPLAMVGTGMQYIIFCRLHNTL